MKKKVLLVDNYDSFTYNLYQIIKSLDYDVIVIRNDELNLDEIEKFNFDKIIISPGPSKPIDSGTSIEVVKKFYKKVPMLGVCLGMQIIALAFGIKTIKSKDPVHGKIAKLNILDRKNSVIYKRKIPQDIEVMRYHSLVIEKVPDNFYLTGTLINNNIIMSIKHKKYNLIGIQYHPESFLTQYGKEILENFLNSKN